MIKFIVGLLIGRAMVQRPKTAKEIEQDVCSHWGDWGGYMTRFQLSDTIRRPGMSLRERLGEALSVFDEIREHRMFARVVMQTPFYFHEKRKKPRGRCKDARD